MFFILWQVLIYFFGNSFDQYITLRDNTAQFNTSFDALKKDFQKQEESILKIVVIGSSLVAQGIACPNEIQTLALEKYNTKVQLNKIFLFGNHFEFLVKEQGVFDNLIDLKPDIVFIHNDWLLFDISDYHFKIEKGILPESWIEFYKILVDKNRRFYKGGLKYFREGNQKPNGLRACDYAFYSNEILDTLNFSIRKRTLKSFAATAYLHADLKRLQKAGIKTYILHLPRPFEVDERIFTPKVQKNYYLLLEQYSNKFGIEYWEYEGRRLYFKEYRDIGHLNEKGKSIYSEWLMDKIFENYKK